MAPAFTVRADGARVRDLIKPIRTHSGEDKSIALRPPKYREIMDFGDPSQLIAVSGGLIPHHDMSVVEKYIGNLSGIDPGLLEQLDYRDALALKDAVLDFFQKASETVSTTAPTP